MKPTAMSMILTDKQMTRIKTGGDSFTRESVPVKSSSKHLDAVLLFPSYLV